MDNTILGGRHSQMETGCQTSGGPPTNNQAAKGQNLQTLHSRDGIYQRWGERYVPVLKPFMREPYRDNSEDSSHLSAYNYN